MSVLVNGASLLACGLLDVSRKTPDATGRDVQAARLAGGYGGPALLGGVADAEVLAKGTVVGAPGIGQGDRSGATPTQLQAYLSALRTALQGEQAVAVGNLPDREWHGYLKELAIDYDRWGAEEQAVAADVTLRWTTTDPLAIAVAETFLPGADVTLTGLGDAPCPLRIEVYNDGVAPITQIVVSVFRYSTVLTTLSWAGSLAVGASWTLDDEGYGVTNAGLNAVDGLSAASVFPVADPGDRPTRVTVAMTGATGSACVRYHARSLG